MFYAGFLSAKVRGSERVRNRTLSHLNVHDNRDVKTIGIFHGWGKDEITVNGGGGAEIAACSSSNHCRHGVSHTKSYCQEKRKDLVGGGSTNTSEIQRSAVYKARWNKNKSLADEYERLST